MDEKPIFWCEDMPPLSGNARLEAGVLLRRLQRGELLSPPHSKPMPDIGKKCHELRIKDGSIDWRIIYHLSFECIVILHIFEKKSQKTPRKVILKCKSRLTQFYKIIGELS